MSKKPKIAMDKKPRVSNRVVFALDKSARTKDVDGRLHVQLTNISKATVNEYAGQEIPDFDLHGLEANKLYRLLRAPDELSKAAASFNQMPLLTEHVPVSAEEPRSELVVGATGSDTVFESPYLKSSLVVWDQDAIDLIESREQAELSCAYRYTPDMTPGVYEGMPYDGVMREIVGNHVALVTEGRAGPDVVVADSKPEQSMKLSRIQLAVRAALGTYLRPRLAQDASLDLTPLVRDADVRQAKARKVLAKQVVKATTKMMAKDAEITPEELEEVVEAVSEDPEAEEEGAEDAGAEALNQVIEFLAGKLDEEDLAEVRALLMGDGAEDEHIGWNEMVKKLMDKGHSKESAEKIAGSIAKKKGEDESSEEAHAHEVEAGEKANEEERKERENKAMDEKLREARKQAEDAAIKRMRAIQVAEKEVAPILGEIDTSAMNSAAEVYRMALDHKGIEVAGVDPSAYRAMVKMIPRDEPRQPFAQDAGAHDEFARTFPNAVIPRSL